MRDGEDYSEYYDLEEVRALPSDKMRRFVIQYAHNGNNGKLAAMAAGYGGKNPQSVAVRASALLASDAIVKAFKAITGRMLSSATLPAMQALRALVADPTHRDHFKACQSVLSRGGFPELREQHITIEKVETEREKYDRMCDLAQRIGVPLAQLIGPNRLATLEAEFGKPAPVLELVAEPIQESVAEAGHGYAVTDAELREILGPDDDAE